MKSVIVFYVFMAFLAVSSCVLPVWAYTDEPAAVADWQTLLRRIETLERRVDALESAALQTVAESPAPADKRPVLEVHSETWCGPCQVFKADLAAAGEVPVEVRWVRFSDRVPAFRWTGPDGRQVVRTGYQRGGLRALLAEVTEGKP